MLVKIAKITLREILFMPPLFLYTFIRTVEFPGHFFGTSTGVPSNIWRKRRVQKKVIFTACHSGKLKLTFTSPNIISTSPKNVLMSRLISQFLCNLNSLRNFTCPSGKLITELTSPIAKSTSPELSDTTFFARWNLSWVDGSLDDHPSYHGRANFAYIALKHLANLLDEKQKVGSARRVTRLARSSFLHKNTLARPVIPAINPSLKIPAKARKSEHARELLARASKGVKG